MMIIIQQVLHNVWSIRFYYHPNNNFFVFWLNDRSSNQIKWDVNKTEVNRKISCLKNRAEQNKSWTFDYVLFFIIMNNEYLKKAFDNWSIVC